MGLHEYTFYPEDIGGNSLCSLACFLRYVNDQAIADSDEPMIGITEAGLALIDKIREEIKEEVEPFKDLMIVRYSHVQENKEAGVAGKFIRFETRPNAPYQMVFKDNEQN